MANITTQTIRVDLSTDKVIPTAYTHQNDTARTLVFDMYNGGLPYTMTGNTVKFAYKSPVVNGQYSVITGSGMESGTVSGNTVTVALPVAYTRISGVGLLTMIITPSSGTIRPVNIRLVVQKSADGANEIAGSSDFPTELQEYVDAWMDENVEPIIDDTLSVSGNAAEAKVTGERLNSLNNMVDVVGSKFFTQPLGSSTTPGMYPMYTRGILPSTGETNGTSWETKRLRTGFISIAQDTMLYLNNPDYLWCVWTYSSNSDADGVMSLTGSKYISSENPVFVKADADAPYIRVGFWRADEADMNTDSADATSDFVAIQTGFKLFTFGLADDIEVLHQSDAAIGTDLYTAEIEIDRELVEGGLSNSGGGISGSQWNPYRYRTKPIPLSAVGGNFFTLPSGYRVTAWTYSTATPSTSSRVKNLCNNKYLALDSFFVPYDSQSKYIVIAFEHLDRVSGHKMTTDATDPTSDYSIISSGIHMYSLAQNLSLKTIDMTGLEYLNSVSIAPTANAWISDMTFIGENLWIFSDGADDHSDTANINVMSYDPQNLTLTGIGKMTHNFGHCNTVDYCPQNDTLIMGNGGGSSNTEHDQIYIIQNASGLYVNNANLVLANVALVIDLDNLGLDWGKQINAFWAYANYGRYDLIYVMSNDGNIQNIRLVQLGKGSNALTYGTAVSASDSQFNGTFNLIREWQRPYDTTISNNGTQLYKGKIWEASGHDGVHCDKMTLLSDGTIKSEFMKHYLYGADGSQLAKTTEGIALKDGVLLLGNATDKKVMFFAVD